ncbi:PAS domain S-box protein [Marivirga salinae]|uniref:histidine kinase n=1 Tax=Marivirga salinarum TaxID=3059078 RepID=A0AA51RAG2_9BACT|nr:PAS domain S-box protein [Marivirga sp. BDSF4-3]WMN11101.1 PAS domain S-box protein [Marivirga sp. BDSF4-3]
MNHISKIKRKNKSLIFSIAIGAFTAIVFSTTILISYQYYQKLKTQQLQSELNLVTENIRRIMTNSNFAAFAVGLTIDPTSDTIKNFKHVAKEIMARHPYLYGVQILRKGEIQYVYPYDLHQSVIGFDILKDSETSIEANKAIINKKIYYAGPLEFQQGGIGIVGRLPIFHEKEFWGFSAVLIKMEDFLKASGITNSEIENISFQLSKINPNTKKEEYFTTNKSNGSLLLSYQFEESGWKISGYYQQDPLIYILLAVVITLTIASSLGSGLHSYQLLKKPEKLESLLSEKTKEIEVNNDYLTSMVKAIPDLIFIYDKDANYLDFHAYQHSLLIYKPNEFIGKSVYQLFEKKFAENIHLAIQKAISSKEITEHSYYLDFKDGRKYFESRFIAINSEKVLAVVREVTESKLSAQELEKSEQKYRNLVSQASDAIFVTDESGNLIELNEKGFKMTGIPVEKITEYNLNQLVKLQNRDSLTITDIIHENGAALEEAILFSENKIDIPIEINCKLTSQGQIQGIIRDISVRNNYIRSIKQQNERFKEIAWIQSHEVRAPLARLLGLLDYLEKFESIHHDDKVKVIQSIRDSSLELDLIIRDVVKRTDHVENNT